MHKQSGKWQAHLYFDDKLHYLGLFIHEHEAAQAYDAKAREVWGADAFLNFPAYTNLTRKRGASVEQVVDQVLDTLGTSQTTDPVELRAELLAALRALRNE